MSTEPSLKTKFTYTIIPNTAQYKWAKWDEHLQTVPASTLENAKARAEKDPSVSYFFHMKSSMVLEQLQGQPSKSFSPGDAVFFSGDNLWLGSAPGMSDTYLIAEQYDTSDQATRDYLMQLLQKDFVLNGKSTTSGTKEEPVKLKAGWVFVDFADVKGGDRTSLRKKLEGPHNELTAFVERESNGRVKLILDMYKDWVTLPENHTAYENNFNKIAQDVDAKIDFPSDWDVALFAFPDVDPDPNTATSNGNTNLYVAESGGNFLSNSQCLTGKMVDGSQPIQFAFMDPKHYSEQISGQEPTTHITTIHELMHALCLPDIYYTDSNRSYGWSIMSAAGAGRHITQFEKLLLGWEDPANFIFLKRGLIPTDQLLAPNGVKGIVIMPEGDREDTYFIEVAQEIGVGQANLDKFNAKNKDDYGLLLMIVRKDRTEGVIVPYVYARPADALADEKVYGGASGAAFKKAAKFSTNGIFSYPTPPYAIDSGNPISRLVGVNGNYKASDRATILRENDRIVSGDDIFMMSTTGVLGFDKNAGIPVGDYNLYYKDYGFVAFVDNKGNFKVAAAVDDNPLKEAEVKTFSPPAGTVLTEGKYYFKIEKDESGQPCIGIYKESEPQRQYVLFRKPQNTLSRGWKFEQGRSQIVLGNDGNLVVIVDKIFKQGSRQVFGLDAPKGKPHTIHFDDNGAMTWLDMWGSQINHFAPTTTAGKLLSKPFKLAVSDPQADQGSLLVTDATGATVCKVFDY